MTCISCPIGCTLTVHKSDSSEEITVTGNKCPRGEVYAREELLAPKRIVTATVPLSGGDQPRVPVRTLVAIPKELIPGLLRRLYGMTVEAPVRLGDTLLSNYLDSDVSVVAAKSCRRGDG